jgi:hypothetical protein
MGCHYIDLVFWSLDLTYPETVEATAAGGPNPETAPKDLKVKWTFPARRELPPLSLTWYDGSLIPRRVLEVNPNPFAWNAGVLFIGDRGTMFANYDEYQLFPKERFADFAPPPQTIPASSGHHAEWISACKTGEPTSCRFEYSGPLTETVLLGNVAFRSGCKIAWDPKRLRARNAPETERYLCRENRAGWRL